MNEFTHQTPGAVCESAASGAWNNAATWSCGHVPLSCDQVVAGHVVTLSQSVQVRGVELRQNGQVGGAGGERTGGELALTGRIFLPSLPERPITTF